MAQKRDPVAIPILAALAGSQKRTGSISISVEEWRNLGDEASRMVELGEVGEG